MQKADGRKQDRLSLGNHCPGFLVHRRNECRHATLTIGRMQGGTADNILARHARFFFDLRCPPEDDAHALLAPFAETCHRRDAQLKAAFPGAGVTLTELANAPPMTPSGSADAEAFVRTLTGDNRPAGAVAYAAEGGQFEEEEEEPPKRSGSMAEKLGG